MINSRSDFYVYVHLRADNMEPFYVGKGSADRAYRKNHRSKWWERTVNKYGYIIKIVDNDLYEHEAFELEEFLIQELGRKDLKLGTLLNLTDGGDGISGYRFTPEQRVNLSNSHKGERSHNFGKKGLDSPLYGKRQSKETIEKRRLKLIGRKRNDDLKMQASIRMLGVKLSQDTRDKIAKSKCEKVICYTDDGFYKEFNSLLEGAMYFNIHITNISCCCTGTRKSAGKHPTTNKKLHWRKLNAE